MAADFLAARVPFLSLLSLAENANNPTKTITDRLRADDYMGWAV